MSLNPAIPPPAIREPAASPYKKENSLTSFNDFGLVEPILRALAEEKYVTPTPIQTQTIPLALQGRDVIGIAQTGTGKTAAFALPIIQHLTTKRLRPDKKACRVLVLSPTRELSGQISDSFRAYGRHIRPLAVALAIGGVPINKQIRSLAHGVEVLVATPGRLIDLVNQRALRLDQVEVLVLDEADRMLDMGFIHDIKRIVAMLRKERQTLFFSATMPQEITRLADAMLRDPARVAVTPQATTVEKVEQRVILTEKASKQALLAEVLKAEPVDRVLVFTRTKHGADKVVRGLQKAGHRRRGDPRQQVAEPARARARGLPRRQACARLSPPTSPPAASTSTASATWSITTCRTSRNPTSTASAAPRAPAPRAWRSRSAITRKRRSCAISNG